MLKLKDDYSSTKMLFIFILIAYVFSVGMRFIWVNEVSVEPQFYWNNELMITTNDGYLFAEGARDILAGSHQPNDLSSVNEAISQLTALLAKVLPISFETLILYMPAFIGSLVVIPLILIGRALNQTTMGFIAALIGSIAHSYYNRTMTGYYDTDMLNIVFPILEMYSLILALTHQRNRTLIPITISVALYQWWYPQAYALDTALFGMIVLFTLVFDRKNLYLYKIALFILIGILAIPLISKISLAILVFSLFHFKKELSIKLFWPIFATVLGLYFLTGGIEPIWFRLKIYFLTDSGENTIVSTLHYYNVMSTVQEANNIPFNVFAQRISGNILAFIFALIGYIMAIIAYRPLLITLPLVILGFTAMSSGLRFTIYAVPAMAIGSAYLIVYLSRFIQISALRYIIISILTLFALYPNYLHIKEYIMPTVFAAPEVATLEKLKTIASREDYVVGWWDYGYPIRYYADVKTWVDGGKHTGDVNYPTSYVLNSQDQLSTANMLRFYTEYTERGFQENNKTLNDFEFMLHKEGFSEPDDFLNAIALPETKRPAKTRDVYLYLPLRMLEIVPTVTLFSNLTLSTGAELEQPFFYSSQSIQETQNTIELGNDIRILKDKNMLNIHGQEGPIKTFYEVSQDANNAIQVRTQAISSQGLNVIYMASYNKFLIVDDFYLNSTYIQMFVFEHYDKNLFEPVILEPMTKIFKLKV